MAAALLASGDRSAVKDWQKTRKESAHTEKVVQRKNLSATRRLGSRIVLERGSRRVENAETKSCESDGGSRSEVADRKAGIWAPLPRLPIFAMALVGR